MVQLGGWQAASVSIFCCAACPSWRLGVPSVRGPGVEVHGTVRPADAQADCYFRYGLLALHIVLSTYE
jgi:hypothetical protein